MTNRPRSPGRPSRYTDAIAGEICSRIVGGESLRSICNDEHIPHIDTVMGWLSGGRHAQFSEQYARAREISGDSDADRIAHIAEQMIAGAIKPDAGRAAIDAYKWTAARKNPKRYGDRLQTEHAGPGGAAIPLNLESLTDAQLDTLIERFERAVPDRAKG